MSFNRVRNRVPANHKRVSQHLPEKGLVATSIPRKTLSHANLLMDEELGARPSSLNSCVGTRHATRPMYHTFENGITMGKKYSILASITSPSTLVFKKYWSMNGVDNRRLSIEVPSESRCSTIIRPSFPYSSSCSAPSSPSKKEHDGAILPPRATILSNLDTKMSESYLAQMCEATANQTHH